ncbi:serine hydrolase domain-containing protein [Streptomyces cadmiisoli]|uniref:Serine hydrolase n=1 Tax=Streptomyces cadmiisoli TaxID=2184053 RepID=A0A2Z4J6F0_9ACTN|nr:serine hydrolase domain-containing protein [Streptomyces cadmiisoli]AWW40248.1 serine hydrolase [Streptomyces cadmiisoli]
MICSCRQLRRGAVTAAALGVLVVPAGTGPVLASPAPAPAAATVQPSPSPTTSDDGFRALTPEVKRQVDEAVLRVMREADVPGVTVGLWTPDKGTHVRSFGVADKATGQEMSPDLSLRIGSETKTFTVTALLKLVDEGRLGLDDTIGEYVDGVPNGDETTLRQLAGMRSGLFNYTEDQDFFKALTSDPERSFTPRQLLDYAFKHPVLFQPGEKFSYSNTNLILLGLVVEQVARQPLQEYIGRTVLEPAGMERTLLPTNAAFPSPHAQGYTDQTADGKIADTAGWNPSWAWAAGAMISTLEDLRVWAPTVATGVLPDGEILISPATQQQRLDTRASSIPGAGYGLGIFDVGGWLGHNGSLPGYESLTVYLPSARATMVVLLNTDVDHDGSEPSTLFGDAITKIVSPEHVFDLPAQPAGR